MKLQKITVVSAFASAFLATSGCDLINPQEEVVDPLTGEVTVVPVAPTGPPRPTEPREPRGGGGSGGWNP